jgi:hypothetical protein
MSETFAMTTQPDPRAAEQLSKPILGQKFEIVDDDTLIAAGSVVRRHDEVIKKLTEGDGEKFLGFDGFVNGLYKMHKASVQLRAQFVQPLLDSKTAWLKRIQAFTTKREAEAARTRELAAETLRKEEAKALEKDAKKLQRQGEAEAAAVLREQAATLPVPTLPVERATPRLPGSVETPVWKFSVADYSKVPMAYRTLDPMKKTEREIIDSKIRAVVAKLGNTLPIEGVEVWNENKLSFRSEAK